MQIPIRHSSRAKRMILVVHWDGRAEVVVPKIRQPSDHAIRTFLNEHQDWIDHHVRKRNNQKHKTPLTHRGIAKETVGRRTRELVEAYIGSIEQSYNIKNIRVRMFKSQWGSCSSARVLSFHYKLSLLPEHLAHYIIVHELCHLKHMNHSKVFWAEVERLCPDHKACRRALRAFLI
jgi:predicted metal-dependent hydrolase